ncbi:GNAT family N-acetyltransferase [Jannaschia sp. LMIT008]|uniref:GNAT family N-acetyltransferase n=1 Tax=Jannaschia maritima TaxID=3032585 RepID=UPI002811801D|nr:GNAT family N-acetyltransferase [Jannaschia sp. LMIT008]
MTSPLPPTLTTDRLTLRPFQARDMAPYVAYYTGPRTTGVGGPRPPRVAAERFLAMAGQWAVRGFGRYAIAQDGPAFGHVGMMQVAEADPVEMTWTLWDAACEGHGYATEAARAVLAAWRGGPLVVRVDRDNAASLRVAARLGLAEDGDAAPPASMPGARTFRWAPSPLGATA